MHNSIIKCYSLFIIPIALLVLNVYGETNLTHGGIVGGGGAVTGGKYHIQNVIGQSYLPVLLNGNNITVETGLFSGFENPPYSKKSAISNGRENSRIEFSYSEIIDLLNIYDPDGDEIEINLETLTGNITSEVIKSGNIIHWKPPENENRDINAFKVTVSDGRLSEVEGLISAYLEPEPYQLFFLEEPKGGYTDLNESLSSKVRIADRNGITISTASNNVLLSILTGSGSIGAFFYGENSLFAIDGIANFNGLRINKQGEKYQLIASSPGLLSATSSSFNLQKVKRNEIKDQPGYPSFVTTDITTINAPLSAINLSAELIGNKFFPDKDPIEIKPEYAPIGVDPERVPDHLKPKAIDQELDLTNISNLDIALNLIDPQNKGLVIDVTEFPKYGRIGKTVYESSSINKNVVFTSVEMGDEVILDKGSFSLTDLELDLWSVFDGNENPNLTLFIYNNDGASINEYQNKPNTVIYKSSPIKLQKDFQTISLKNLNINVKDKFTWSVKFNGLKNTISSRAGLVLGESSLAGQSYSNYWLKINDSWEISEAPSNGKNNNYSAKIWAYEKYSTTLAYTPYIGFIGEDFFKYSILNFVNLKDSAKVTINVKGVIPSPINTIDKSTHTISIRVLPSKPFRFEFPTLNSFIYVIESTNNFSDWKSVKVIIGDNTVHQYSNLDNLNSNYYRIKILQ